MMAHHTAARAARTTAARRLERVAPRGPRRMTLAVRHLWQALGRGVITGAAAVRPVAR